MISARATTPPAIQDSLRDLRSTPLEDALSRVRALISADSAPDQNDLDAARTGLGDAIMASGGLKPADPVVLRVLQLIQDLAERTDQSLKHATVACNDGSWRSLLSLMVRTSAESCKGLPAMGAVPTWLWPTFAAFIFAPLRQGRGANLVSHCEELASWMRRNRGSTSVRAAFEQWQRCAVGPITSASAEIRYRYARARGQLLEATAARLPTSPVLPVAPRQGRRLRLGLICSSLKADLATARLFALFQNLDRVDYEVRLLIRAIESPQVQNWAAHLAPLALIPADPATAVSQVSAAGFDILVFADDLSGPAAGTDPLALHRLAPLQIALDHGGSTGLPEIDVLLCAADAAAGLSGATTERLALLRDWRGALFLPSSLQPPVGLSRESLALPADAVLLTAIAGDGAPSAETMDWWVRCLTAIPEARLVIAYTGSNEEAFCKGVEAGLRKSGLGLRRTSIFPAESQKPGEIAALLGLSDLFLDSAPSEPWWTIEAIARGRPVVRLRGGRPAHELLSRMGLPDMEVDTTPQATALVLRWVGEAAARQNGLCKIAQLLSQPQAPNFDAVSASESFAGALEAAFDELSTLGGAALRDRTASPLMTIDEESLHAVLQAAENAVESDDRELAAFETLRALRAAPASTHARLLRGRALLAEGKSDRAVQCLSSAAARRDAPPAVWLWLAGAYEATGAMSNALEVLETGLRLNPQAAPLWLKLARLADAAGAIDLAREAASVLQQLQPEDPEVLALAQRLAA